MKPLPAIPQEEYQQRFERARALMREKGLRALLVGTGTNLAYFTGYPSPAKSVPRPFFALLPLEGDPVFFVHSGRRYEAERFSWIRDVRDYKELSRVPAELIREAFGERGLLGRKVGMELGFEQSLDFSILEFERLKSAFGDTSLADASDILWRLRWVKSENEIACLRRACWLTAEAYRATFASVREGMLESAVYQTMKRHLEEAAGGDIFLVITSGEGNYDLATKPPEDRPLRRGDLVWLDAGCTVSGYWSDFSRGGIVGEPSPEQEHAQEIVHAITMQAVAMARPGVAASSIARFCERKLDEACLPITSRISGLAGRVGHGVGLDITEPPHLGEHDDTPLEPGMSLTLEPGVATRYGTFHIEENVVVREDGCEILSECPRTLFRIAG